MSSSSSTDLSQLRSTFASSLKAFANSSDTFKIIHTVPPTSNAPSDLKTLYVLDSSFNPPTKAHLTIARNALLRDKGSKPARLMFLLAIENADKKPKPASFEDRLVMMAQMAADLRASLRDHKDVLVPVDVAVTKKPFFMDKAAEIDGSVVYAAGTQQVHLTGYDTVIRIFNAKYYPKDRKLRVLEPFLSRHRLRVCYRVPEGGSEEADRREQERYIEGVGDGSREDEGMKKEWRAQIDLVDDARDVRGFSSTEARKAAGEQREDDLAGLVGDEVARYALSEKLYEDPESVKKSYS